MGMKAIATIVLGCVILFCAACEDSPQPIPGGQATAGSKPGRQGKMVLHLYFAGEDGAYLTAEDRVVARPDAVKTLGAFIVEALIDGPRTSLAGTMPPGTALRAFHLLEDGTAFVDLSKEVKTNHPGGARSEMMTIFSLVNSVVLNVPAIEAVKILIDGQEETTLAGHIDLRYPITANMLLIR